MSYRKIDFTDEQLAYIREHFPTEAACDIADVLHVSAPVIIRKAREMGIEKDKSWSKKAYYRRYVDRFNPKVA